MDEKTQIIGGGLKKVLYAVNTLQHMGLKTSAKTLTAKNTCKACALGMGGQAGGMVNELGEYPSVCNKSIQAQSSDVQAAIPPDVFTHTLCDFNALPPQKLERLGRLAHPIFKAKDSQQYRVVDWPWALDYAAQQFKQTPPERSFFYSSGRSSNEAGFILQLLARLYGTNNVNNCSYYCHQATAVGLTNSIGTATSTIEINDLTGCDLIFLIGANPASNHPRFIHKLKDCRERGGDVIVINPAKEAGLVKFAVPKSAKSMLLGGNQIASEYIQPHIGSDLAVLSGIAKAVLALGGEDKEFIAQYTDHFDTFANHLAQQSWAKLEADSGINQVTYQKLAQRYIASKNTVFAWGMGITHHTHGVDNVEYIANLALLRGMVGKPYAGLLPLRGHSNVQGIGTIGVKPTLPQHVRNHLMNELDITLPTAQGMDTLSSLQAADRNAIDAALLMGGNLYAASPNTQWAEAALNKVAFKLCLTTTLNQSHFFGHEHSECLVLPVTARDEEWQSTTQESMFNYVRLSDGGIKRFNNIKPESDILTELAARLLSNDNIDFTALKQHQKIREIIAKVMPDMKPLAHIGTTKHEFHIKNRLKHSPKFDTTTGRAQFSISTACTNVNTNTEYPYKLATLRSEGQFNTIIYEEKDSYRGTENRWCILMNQQDMQALSIQSKDTVDLKSAYGEMRQVIVYPFDVKAGNLLAYFPEANVLVGSSVDIRSRTPAFKHIDVQIVINPLIT
ncbi:MAG TPA: FdhF/YdeP family oxidoreductase [Thiothrix sp.]|nr:FdhF/YdeP family oxidoreductase [Thiothrix sp.]